MKRVLFALGMMAALAGASATARAQDAKGGDDADLIIRHGAACGTAKYILQHPGDFAPDVVQASFDYVLDHCTWDDPGTANLTAPTDEPT